MENEQDLSGIMQSSAYLFIDMKLHYFFSYTAKLWILQLDEVKWDELGMFETSDLLPENIWRSTGTLFLEFI